MKVILTEYPTEDDWNEVKKRALVTIGKKMVNPPSREWKYDILKARHSPIRRLRFSFYLEGIPSYVATHLVRHIHAQPYVKSQRNDRQDEYDRTKAPQDAPVNMIWDMSAEELMNIANKRLCNLADPVTQKVIALACKEVIKADTDDIWRQLLVPMCKYLGCCKEMKPCGKPVIEVV